VLPRLSLLLLLPVLLPNLTLADDHWIALKSGPFEVYSNTGDRPAREKLMYLEQFRETLRVITGKQEMRMVWPVHLLIYKNAAEIPVAPKPFRLGRDARMAAITEAGGFSPDNLKELARLLLYENTNRLPPQVEQGLMELVSTVQIDGPRITLGAPVPPAERSPGWALMQLVTVNPEYAGRSSVMISNLEQSGDFEAAYHNAFEKTAAQIQQQVDAYLKAGNFPTAFISGRALSMTRDFKPVQLASEDVRIEQADLLLAAGHTAEALAAYKALHGPEPLEGMALMDLDDQKDSQARTELKDAIEAGSKSARAWLELGRLQSDADQLKKAGELNPRWAEPYFQLADIDPAIDKEHLEQRAALLKKACALDPRNSDYWIALAKTDVVAKDFAEAQKAWAGAERAAATDEEREHIHQVRLQVEEKRFDYEAEERKRIKDEQERDLERVRAQSEAAIHASEDAARKKMNPNGAVPPKPQGWYEEPKAGPSVQGVFQRLDCLDQRARLVIQTPDGKSVQLLMADPSKVTTGGGGDQTLVCGAQKGARQVTVHYNVKADAKLHTTGEVTSIEFQ
jgi:cytochrome c-type biogenesis protein CcmH/NrfG